METIIMLSYYDLLKSWNCYKDVRTSDQVYLLRVAVDDCLFEIYNDTKYGILFGVLLSEKYKLATAIDKSFFANFTTKNLPSREEIERLAGIVNTLSNESVKIGNTTINFSLAKRLYCYVLNKNFMTTNGHMNDSDLEFRLQDNYSEFSEDDSTRISLCVKGTGKMVGSYHELTAEKVKTFELFNAVFFTAKTAFKAGIEKGVKDTKDKILSTFEKIILQ